MTTTPMLTREQATWFFSGGGWKSWTAWRDDYVFSEREIFELIVLSAEKLELYRGMGVVA